MGGYAAAKKGIGSGVFQKGHDEAHIPTKQQKACQKARISSSNVDTCRPSSAEGPPSPRKGASFSLTSRAAPVRGRGRFRELTQSPFRSRSGPVRVHFSPDLDSGAKSAVAYAVTRKIGGAVVRNRCRRRLRAIVAEVVPGLPRGTYLISVGTE